MKIYSTKFKDLKIIKLNKYRDKRGDLIKIFNKQYKIFKINCFESYISFSKKVQLEDYMDKLENFHKINYILHARKSIGFSY